MFNFTLHMCTNFSHGDVPPLVTQLLNMQGVDKVCQPCQMGNPQHPSTDPPENTCSNNHNIITYAYN